MSCCELVFVKNHLSVCAYTLSVLFILAIIYLLGLSGCLGVGGAWLGCCSTVHTSVGYDITNFYYLQ